MSIDAVQPVVREIPTASAVPQLSLTRRDRELQREEGQPPLEVASAEQEALRWKREEDLREKWRKRREMRNASRNGSLDETPGSPETQEEEETGTLFDDRS